jgi:hypothetical protein
MQNQCNTSPEQYQSKVKVHDGKIEKLEYLLTNVSKEQGGLPGIRRCSNGCLH